MTKAESINILGAFCGKRDVAELTGTALFERYGFYQADVMVLFGGSILCGGDVLASAMREQAAKKYVIVGGEGHTTEALRKRVHQEFPDIAVTGKTEAEVFSEYIDQKYGLNADLLECKSTNCGNNITLLLELLREQHISFQSIILSQDATMQRRMEAVLRKYIPEEVTVINFATYQAKVVEKAGKLEYDKKIYGMWDMERYISLLLGEIPRLTDDEAGYGPKGKNFIVHVDIPEKVRNAFETLMDSHSALMREANPLYASNSQLIWKNQTKLRTGYTTGSCAAAAAKAAARMALTGEEVQEISLLTPAGIRLYLEVVHTIREEGAVSCAIRKDSGDDPDVTNGIYVYAKVSICKESQNIVLEAGEGIGRVTRKGLEQAVGEPAINKVPRQMILQAAEEERTRANYKGGMKVLIWIPEGERLAAKTFNPKLGIEGGISVLGTSGIVEPMSEKALTDTIFLEMNMRRENGMDYCYVVPGNYGADFLREQLGYEEDSAVKCSNYIGEAIDDAVQLQMKGVLLVGHVGKLIKLAAGIMNTHSRQADGRMEILAAHAAMAGASGELVKSIMGCVTTTEALELMRNAGILETAMRSVMEKIEYHLTNRAGEVLQIGAVMFSKEEGILGKTKLADELADKINGQNV